MLSTCTPIPRSGAAAPTLLHVFSTFAVGGPQVRYAQLANAFGRSFRHRILAMDGRYDCLERLAPELDVAVINVPVAKGRSFANAKRFRRALKEIRPHLLATYNWGAIEWALANFPAIVRHLHVEDGFGPEEASRQLPRRVWTRRLALARSTVVLPSRTLFRLATEVWHLDVERVRYVPNGIDCARFAGHNASGPPVQWAGTGPVIGTVAALRREKNLSRLMRAVRLLREDAACRLVIVGDGPEKDNLERLAFGLGIGDRVFFTGHVADPSALYGSFDIVALSSDTEQMPYTVLEAMAAGLPVAATAVGDIPEMVARENLPFLVPRTEDALAGALRNLLIDPELRAQIGIANRRKALEEYDEQSMLAAYEVLFRGLDTGAR